MASWWSEGPGDPAPPPILSRGGGLRRACLAGSLLDPGELFLAPLHDRALEPVPCGQEPPAADEEERPEHGDDRVVEGEPRELFPPRDPRRRGREDEQDRDERDPDARDDPDRLVPAPERPFARLPAVAGAEA